MQTGRDSNYENDTQMKNMASEKRCRLEYPSQGATISLVAHPPLLDGGEAHPSWSAPRGEMSRTQSPHRSRGRELTYQALTHPSWIARGARSQARTPHNTE